MTIQCDRCQNTTTCPYDDKKQKRVLPQGWSCLYDFITKVNLDFHLCELCTQTGIKSLNLKLAVSDGKYAITMRYNKGL